MTWLSRGQSGFRWLLKTSAEAIVIKILLNNEMPKAFRLQQCVLAPLMGRVVLLTRSGHQPEQHAQPVDLANSLPLVVTLEE
jgi:hypothetical protein